MKVPAESVFWFSGIALAYIYFVFPAICALRGIVFPRPPATKSITPFVSICIAAFNEENIIRDKILNTVSIDYPSVKYEIIIASDGSTDKTVEIVRKLNYPNVKVLDLPRKGKNHALNEAVKIATGEILIFTDADIILDSEAIRVMTSYFADLSVGCVAGNYRHKKEATNDNTSERGYWRFDMWLKDVQSSGGSATCATGALYAIRRCLFELIPDGVTDDYFVSTRAAANKLRIVNAANAKAWGYESGSVSLEYSRKVRIISAGLLGVWKSRALFNPARYGWYSIQLITHKVLRRLAFIPLVLLFASSVALIKQNLFYFYSAFAQLIFHLTALAGYLLSHTGFPFKRIISIPYYFDMTYIAVAHALYNNIKGRRGDIWNTKGRNKTS